MRKPHGRRAAGAGPALLLLALLGCAKNQADPFSYLKYRFKDALEMADIGLTVSFKPQ